MADLEQQMCESIRACLSDGMSNIDIAAAFGITPQAVSYHMLRMGMRRRHTPIDEKTKKRIAELRAKRITWREISEITGMKVSTLMAFYSRHRSEFESGSDERTQERREDAQKERGMSRMFSVTLDGEWARYRLLDSGDVVITPKDGTGIVIPGVRIKKIAEELTEISKRFGEAVL